ncbi:hypothetical protein OL229_10415 [Neisseriaceae bacterium JH1-16]|nr:hypothetical protein [Neisseriaceae bacterium JH1-16]
MNAFISEFLRAAKQAPRLYFAPLIGAVQGTREAWQDALSDPHQEVEHSKRAPSSRNEEK